MLKEAMKIKIVMPLNLKALLSKGGYEKRKFTMKVTAWEQKQFWEGLRTEECIERSGKFRQGRKKRQFSSLQVGKKGVQ